MFCSCDHLGQREQIVGDFDADALAVLRLITISNLVGACTGRSAGFSPLRMRGRLSALAEEERTTADKQPAGTGLRDRCKGRLKLSLVFGVHHQVARPAS